MKEESIHIKYTRGSTKDFPSEVQDLIHASRKIALDAHAPYSNFKVGAAILLEDGTVITGNNQENVAYPSGLCAERTALFYMGAHHKGKKISKMAVFVFSDVTAPCGGCRQSMMEYANLQDEPIEFFMASDKDEVIKLDDMKDLMPLGLMPKLL